MKDFVCASMAGDWSCVGSVCVLLLAGALACSSNDSNGGGGAGQTGDGAAGGGQSGSGGLSGTGGVSPSGGTGGVAGSGGVASGGSGNGGTGGTTLPDASLPPVACRAPTPNLAAGNECKNTPPPALQLTPIVTSGLNEVPLFLTYAPGDATRLFVVERGGRIWVIRDGVLEADPFLDLRGLVGGPGIAGEQGLLGLAFDPNYQETGRFWVNYSALSGDTQVVEYRGTPGQPADPGSATPLLQVTQPYSNHNGGMLAFGPDGCLFIGMGDGGSSNDPDNHGQNAGDALGNMLRVDVDAYPTPAPGNMTGAGVDPHSWDYGLRNPWRFSFDRATGDLYIGDVGQDAWEEVDVEPVGVGQRNYGWNIMEGAHCRGGGTTCDMSGLILPAAEQPNKTEGGSNRAVIGGYVYRGTAIPGLVGRYIYGDYQSRMVWSFTWAGETDGVPTICDEYELSDISPPWAITSFGEDAAGELYVVTNEGDIYRIDPG